MHISISEARSAVAKAVKYAGLSLGLGEDVGAAMARLLGLGIDPFPQLVPCLKATDEGSSVPCDLEAAGSGRFQSLDPERPLSALAAGAAAGDFAASRKGDLVLENVDVPLVAVALLLNAAAENGLDFQIKGGKPGLAPVFHCACDGQALRFEVGSYADLQAASGLDLQVSAEVRPGAVVDMALPPAPDGAEVAAGSWRDLCRYADRSLVEGSEASRLSGAGAGVIDTD